MNENPTETTPDTNETLTIEAEATPEISLEEIRAENQKLQEQLQKLQKDYTLKVSTYEKKEKARKEAEMSESEKYQAQIQALMQEVKSAQVDRFVSKYKGDFNDDAIDLLKDLVSKGLEFDESGKISNETEELEKLIKGVAEKFPSLVKIKQQPKEGAGTTEGIRSQDPKGIPRDFESWPKDQQIRFFRENPTIRKQFLSGKLT